MPIERGDDSLARLASRGDKREAAFLAPHHLAAAERLERLILRAQLMPRVTMSYDPTRIGGRNGAGNDALSATEASAAARQKLNALAANLPSDCWGVLFDVCGLGKGLQLVETERRWPRRSAKLVLRIGLDQLAAQFGLSPEATGAGHGVTRNWLETRLPLIADESP